MEETYSILKSEKTKFKRREEKHSKLMNFTLQDMQQYRH